jgi:hypothetical protein
MSYFSLNTEFLCRRYPGFHEEIIGRYPPASTLKPIETRSGAVSATYGTVYLHSRRDPRKEAERMIGSVFEEAPGGVVFAGFGLGYQVEALLRRYPSVPVYIVVADVALFLASLDLRDFRGIFELEQVSLFLGTDPDTLPSFIPDTLDGELRILRLRSVYGLNPDFYGRLEDAVRAYSARRQININTLEKFGRRWTRNLFRNLPVIWQGRGISAFQEIFSGLPALVIAAGPSLDEIIPELERLHRRCVLIAVDTAVRALVSAGITPDFLLVVDPQYWNSRHLDPYYDDGACVISESSTYPSVFRRLGTTPYLGESLFPLGRYFEAFTGVTGKLGAGGSVATSAWDFARFAGCIPIYMAGLDLGFPDAGTHYKGSFFEYRSLGLCERTVPAETFAFKAMYDAHPFPVPANRGGEVMSDSRLIVYKWWFERQMQRYPDCDTYNLSAAGVAIEGMPYRSVREIISGPNVRREIDARLHTVRREAGPIPRMTVTEALDTFIRDLTEIRHNTERALTLTDELESALKSHGDLATITAAMEEIDGHILNSSGKDIAAFLIQPIIRRLAAGSPQSTDCDDRPTAVDSSRELYSELLESSSYHIELATGTREALKKG